MNHFSTRWGNAAALYFQPVSGSPVLQRLSARLAHRILRISLALFRVLGIARYYDESERAPSERGRVLWEEARQRGIEMRGYALFGKPADTYRARVAGKTIVFAALPRPLVSESGSEEWLDDKWLLKQKLSEAGAPVPRGGRARTLEDALALFRSLEKPVVVKPRIGSRGRHTTTHIYKEEELREALRRAQELCPEAIVEEHLCGAVYRGTVIGGRLVGILAGEPPRVVGDGKSTIRELVEKKNAARHEKVHEVKLGEQHEAFLARLGRGVESVPKKGESVDLLEKIGVSYGGHSAEVTRTAHPGIASAMEQAARAVEDPVVGFDFIIDDVTASPENRRWGIIECNSLPFINLHHDPVEGEPVQAAAALWDYVEAHAEKF